MNRFRSSLHLKNPGATTFKHQAGVTKMATTGQINAENPPAALNVDTAGPHLVTAASS